MVFSSECWCSLTDVQKLIEKLPADQQAKYTQIYAIADIPKIYYAFYVSDINGSILTQKLSRHGIPVL